MIRITITGSECTGKTTLAKALADHYETVWVPEFARAFVSAQRVAPGYDDVNTIARGQLALDADQAADASRLLIRDTDLLSTVVYSQHYFGDCPKWIETALAAAASDLYLLAAIDVPWSPDGFQRDRGDRRDEMHGLFRAALVDRRLDFVELRGSREQRLVEARRVVDGRMKA